MLEQSMVIIAAEMLTSSIQHNSTTQHKAAIQKQY